MAMLSASPVSAGGTLPEDKSKAVILAYFGVSDDAPPDISLSVETFKSHLAEIESGHYTVLPLPVILGKIAAGEPLAPRTIAITFEGAYRSALQNAIPLLQEAHLPFTVFYASESLDNKSADFIDWADLKQLQADKGVTLGVLPSTYEHLAHKTDTEMLASLNKARQRHREELGIEADYLSYPYGEYSKALQTRAQSQGFKAALGLRSGALYQGENMYALPRFTMTERYGDLDRFRMVTTALPLPVEGLEPEDPYIKDGEWFTGFTLPEALANDSASLSCFLSGLSAPQIQRLGRRIEIRSSAPTLDISRLRLNCTMNGPLNEDGIEQTRWFGMIYHRASGENPDEAEQDRTAQSIVDVSGSPPDELPAPLE
jgi:peptidoglycan/xylan/chitin deacetylase (PgdA/CDA1 family)